MSESTRWLVVIKRETDPSDVTPFEREEDAREFFDMASAQWTESYLCEVRHGPGPFWRQGDGP